MNHKNKLKVVFWNARGISNKLTEFKQFLHDDKIDVACICENFLKNDRSIYIKGYNCFANHRSTGRFGGLAILVREDITVTSLNIPRTSLLECMGIKIKSTNIILAYLPGQSKDKTISNHFIRDINAINKAFHDKYIIGDLNARHRSWNCDSNNRAGNLLYNYVSSNNSVICAPSEHTYCPVSTIMRPSTIDLIVTDAVSEHSDPWVLNKFSSDHLPIRFNIYINIDTLPSTNVFCVHLANRRLYREQLDKIIGPLAVIF